MSMGEICFSASHPMRVRGLKSDDRDATAWIPPVAPHAGAWIEISVADPDVITIPRSHPMRVRGLKYALLNGSHPLYKVAPHAGAWIEICFKR